MRELMLGMLFPLATIDTGAEPSRASEVLNDVMPGLITLAVVGVWLFLIALGRTVPDALGAILQVVVGFYFGQHIAMAAARGIISSNATATQAASAAATSAAAVQAAAVLVASSKP